MNLYTIVATMTLKVAAIKRAYIQLLTQQAVSATVLKVKGIREIKPLKPDSEMADYL
jgi:hypothetical protein